MTPEQSTYRGRGVWFGGEIGGWPQAGSWHWLSQRLFKSNTDAFQTSERQLPTIKMPDRHSWQQSQSLPDLIKCLCTPVTVPGLPSLSNSPWRVSPSSRGVFTAQFHFPSPAWVRLKGGEMVPKAAFWRQEVKWSLFSTCFNKQWKAMISV